MAALRCSSRAFALVTRTGGSRAASTASAAPLEATALRALHVELGGKLVPFAGYELPVQFPTGVLAEHLHARKPADAAVLFDVGESAAARGAPRRAQNRAAALRTRLLTGPPPLPSTPLSLQYPPSHAGHMGQLLWRGRDRARFLETVVVADVLGLKEGASALTLVTTERGTILDDSILSNAGGGTHYMVVNGATKHGDMKHFDAQLAAFRAAAVRAGSVADVDYEYLATQNLVALQGPAASAVLARLVDGGAAAQERVAKMPFMSTIARISVAGKPCSVTRCGYTGEDGYEVGMAAADAEHVARALLGDKRVLPAGLGARDSLRLEAGLCLYGHDMDDTITPNEAALSWVIPKARREAGSPRANFLGAARVLGELAGKSWPKRRVGLTVQGAPAREGARLFERGADPADPAAKPVGRVTSGTFSPVLKAPVAMGYVPAKLAAEGTALSVEVRGKAVPCTVAKMPFVPTRYFRGS